MSISKRIVLIIGILLVVIFVLIGVFSTPRSIDFEPMDGQFALLDKVYPTWFGTNQDVVKTKSGQHVLCDWYRYKALTAGQQENWMDAAEKFTADAMDMVMESSIQMLFWAGETAFENMFDYYDGIPGAKEKLIAACPEEADELEKYLESDRKAFFEIAQREGYVNSAGKLDPQKKRFVHLLHRHLWNQVSSFQFPIERIEPPEEKVAFLRWQIEVSSMSLENKLSKLAVLEEMKPDNYDTGYTKGVLFYQNHMYGEACAAFKQGRAQTDPANSYRIQRYDTSIHMISQEHPAICDKTTAQ